MTVCVMAAPWERAARKVPRLPEPLLGPRLRLVPGGVVPAVMAGARGVRGQGLSPPSPGSEGTSEGTLRVFSSYQKTKRDILGQVWDNFQKLPQILNVLFCHPWTWDQGHDNKATEMASLSTCCVSPCVNHYLKHFMFYLTSIQLVKWIEYS